MTKISIVTPSFNQGRFIGEALESVRMQNHPCVEHFVLDGASTDETVTFLKGLDENSDWSHVRWSSGPDGGQSEALNRGFQMASGDIIGWLNSDDRYRPGCFDHMLKAFAEHPEVDVFYGDFTVMDEKGSILTVRREIEFNLFILLYHYVLYIPTPSTFFRRRIFEESNWLRQDLHYAMDYEFFLRLARAGYRFQHIPEVIADFRLHPESKTCSIDNGQAREKQQVMWSVSPVRRRLHSPRLQGIAFSCLQATAALMRWSEKLLRGYYLRPFKPEAINK